MGEDKQAQQAVENVDGSTAATTAATAGKPAAGPHAKEELTDKDKTPGTGSLPDGDGEDADAGSE